MSTILFTPKDAISAADKVTLGKEGYIIIEVADISQIKTISDLSLIGTDDILVSAIESLYGDCATASIRQDFGTRILKKTTAKLQPKKATT